MGFGKTNVIFCFFISVKARKLQMLSKRCMEFMMLIPELNAFVRTGFLNFVLVNLHSKMINVDQVVLMMVFSFISVKARKLPMLTKRCVNFMVLQP